MIGLESSDSQSESSEHSGKQIRVTVDRGDKDSLNSPSEADTIEEQEQSKKKSLRKRRDFYNPSGCPLGNRCPFKENAIQAWNITKDMADQREELLKLTNKVIQLQNINDENKSYIEALRENDELMKQTIEQQQEELLKNRQEIVSLRLQISQITKAAMAQLSSRTSAHITLNPVPIQPLPLTSSAIVASLQSPPLAPLTTITTVSPRLVKPVPLASTIAEQSPPLASVTMASIMVDQSPPLSPPVTMASTSAEHSPPVTMAEQSPPLAPPVTKASTIADQSPPLSPPVTKASNIAEQSPLAPPVIMASSIAEQSPPLAPPVIMASSIAEQSPPLAPPVIMASTIADQSPPLTLPVTMAEHSPPLAPPVIMASTIADQSPPLSLPVTMAEHSPPLAPPVSMASTIAEQFPSLAPLLTMASTIAEQSPSLAPPLTMASPIAEQSPSLAPPLTMASPIAEQSPPLAPPLTMASTIAEQSPSLAPPLTMASTIAEQSPSLAPPLTMASTIAEQSPPLASVTMASIMVDQSPSLAPPLTMASTIAEQSPPLAPPLTMESTIADQSPTAAPSMTMAEQSSPLAPPVTVASRIADWSPPLAPPLTLASTIVDQSPVSPLFGPPVTTTSPPFLNSDKQKKMLLSVTSIFNSVFFVELGKQQSIDDLSSLLVFNNKPQRHQFSIDEAVKIIKQERAPKLAILRISKKLAISKSQATLLFTEAKRKSATELHEKATGKRKRMSSDDEEDNDKGDESTSKSNQLTGKEKFQNPKALMPWKPTKRVLPPQTRNSVLSWEDQRNYVAIIHNLLKSTPTFRFEHDMKKIKAWDELLREERQLYLDTALRSTKASINFPNSLFVYPDPSSLSTVVNHQLRKSLSQLADRAFQGVLLEIPWTTDQPHNQQQSVALRFNVSVLQPGNGKPIAIPDIRQRCIIKLNNKNIQQSILVKLDKKVPITNDEVMKSLSFQNDIEFLMDGSTFRHLLSAPYGQRPQLSYACRVSIQLEFTGGKMRKVCSIFPPIIASRMHRPFVVREYFKWAFKLALAEGRQSSDGERKVPEKKRPKMAQSVDSLLDELQLGNIGQTAGTSDTDPNKRYTIVTITGEQETDSEWHRLLIRTNVHGIENSRAVSLSVRPEFLPEIAAEKMSTEEILMDLVTATLKGSEEHITFRVHFDERVHQLHLMQIDRKAASDWSKLDQENRKLLSTRIQRLCSLLDGLKEQNEGEYLLTYDDETLRLVQERNTGKAKKMEYSDNEGEEMGLCIQEDEEESGERNAPSVGPVYDLEWIKHFVKMKPILSHSPVEDYWNGIDPHYPLQWHIVRGQIPGALYPKNQRN
ncbi:hypothetical protein niasHT_039335 [Heterodera trifolii]|uniref:Uncharacterized protein n=1 Tax=Heterodera trifolii TaxID=157864 RepID=A0ABD2IMQ0_9BILA